MGTMSPPFINWWKLTCHMMYALHKLKVTILFKQKIYYIPSSCVCLMHNFSNIHFFAHCIVFNFIVLSHWDITPQTLSYDSCPVTLFWQWVNQLRWTTLYMTSIWQRSFNYQFENFGLTQPGIEPRTSQARSECSTMRLPGWFYMYISLWRKHCLIMFKQDTFKTKAKIF